MGRERRDVHGCHRRTTLDFRLPPLDLRRGITALIGVSLVNIKEEIEPTGRVSEPGQEQRRLTAVLGGMVDLVQELLPERVGPRLSLEVHVGVDTRQIRLAQRGDVRRRRILDPLVCRA